MILNNFQKKFFWGKIFFFDFLPFQAILSQFWFFPIFCKIDPIGGGGGAGGDQKSSFAIKPLNVKV